MDEIILRANAKINLALEVVGKREDGYHELRSVMQSLRLHDEINMRVTNRPGVTLRSNLRWLPVDGSNLIVRAAEYIIAEHKLTKGVEIGLTKRIPVSAGMGGGSADCAATLIGMRRLFRLPISDEKLREVGVKFGADVPFCLLRGTALAEGIGEKLTPLPPHPPACVLVVKFSFGVSTATVFKSFDMTKAETPDVGRMERALSAGSLPEICASLGNSLESATFAMCPVVYEVKKAALECGALGALMSGSGPTVFGYFESKRAAAACGRTLRQRFAEVRETIVTETMNPRPQKR